MLKTLRDVDPFLLGAIWLLLILGTAMVYSAGGIFAAEMHGDELFFLKRQAIWLGLGTIAMTVAAVVPYQHYKAWTYPVFFLVCALLLLVLVPGIGASRGGATRWLDFGPVQLQPSEIAKLSMVLYLAYSLEKKQSHIDTFLIGILPHLIFAGLMLFLILIEPDYGTTMTLGALLFVMMYVGGVRLSHLTLLLLAALPVAYFALMGAEYRRARLLAFMDPWKHQQDGAFQLIQSLLAFRAGGVGGVGLGESHQKLFFLPEAHTDFIFSVVGEEWGLLGTLSVILLFFFLAARGVHLSLEAPDPFGRLLGMGVAILIVMQAAINMAVVTGLLPTKGLTLPFISYGGSSLLLTMTMSGILLNVSAQARRRTVLDERPRNPFRSDSGRIRSVGSFA